jgi:hypothetical protein
MHRRLRLAMVYYLIDFYPTGLIPVDFKSIGNVRTKKWKSGLATPIQAAVLNKRSVVRKGVV